MDNQVLDEEKNQYLYDGFISSATHHAVDFVKNNAKSFRQKMFDDMVKSLGRQLTKEERKVLKEAFLR